MLIETYSKDITTKPAKREKGVICFNILWYYWEKFMVYGYVNHVTN